MFITLMFARAKFVSRRAAVSSSCRNSISSTLLCIASFAERNAAISSARVPSRARTKSATASRAATDLYGFFVFGTLGSAASTPSSSSSSYPSIKPLICASSSGSVSARRSPSKTATPVALVKVSRKPSLTRSRSIFDRNVLPTTPAPEASALAARVPSVPSVAASSVGGFSFLLDPAAAAASAAAFVFSLKLFAMVAETSTRAAAPVVLFTLAAVVFVAEAVFALALALFFLNTVPSCTPSKEVETSVETEVSTSVAETSAFAIVVVVVSVVSVVVSSTTSVASFLIASSFATTSLEALAPTELAAASSSPSGPGVDDAAFARAPPPRGARDGSNHPARIAGASDREFARRPGAPRRDRAAPRGRGAAPTAFGVVIAMISSGSRRAARVPPHGRRARSPGRKNRAHFANDRGNPGRGRDTWSPGARDDVIVGPVPGYAQGNSHHFSPRDFFRRFPGQIISRKEKRRDGARRAREGK